MPCYVSEKIRLYTFKETSSFTATHDKFVRVTYKSVQSKMFSKKKRAI